MEEPSLSCSGALFLILAVAFLSGCGGKEGGPAATEPGEVRVQIRDGKEIVIKKEDLEKWPEKNQPTGEGNYVLGYMAYQQKKLDEAEAHFRKAVELDPQMWKGWGHLGATLYQLKRHTEAKASLQKAIQIEEKYAHAYYNLALVYDQLGESEKALQSCRRAIDLEPRDLDAIRLFHHLKQKRK